MGARGRLIVALLAAGAGLTGFAAARATAQQPAALPSDVHPESRNRLPLVRREDLDDAGKAIFDRATSDARSLAGMQGPGGIRLHDPRLGAASSALNRYLRFDAGLDRRLAELAILTTARELDSQFEWDAHAAVAVREGVSPDAVAIVRDRKPLAGLGEREAAIVALAREAVGRHRVAPATFASALRLFGPKQLVDYVALIGDYASTAILLTTFDQQLPPGHVPALPVR